MTRYKLTVEYDGRPFVGWQRQENGLAVAELLERAALGFSGEITRVQGAGRTDAGVHATGQVAHVDFSREHRAETVRDALNFHLLPQPVAVVAAEQVDDGFDARFSAVERRYRYRIINRRPPLTLDLGRAWRVSRPLDAAAMHEAAQLLVGQHDFTSFRAIACQAASPVKTLRRLEVARTGDEVIVTAAARSFLHHQVRNMVGTLALVGHGRWRPEQVRAALEARNRAAAGPTAPPDGLYLTGVSYS